MSPKGTGDIVSFNGSLRDHCLNEEILDRPADARRKRALWRDECHTDRTHFSLGNRTPKDARRTLQQLDSTAPGALAQPETDHDQPQGP